MRYLEVRPEVWGKGVAGTLLKPLRRISPDRAFTPAELYVYTDNERAVQTYRRNGWEPQPEVRRHPFSGQPEQRYALPLTG